MRNKSERIPWSRDEHVLAFNLYCKIPFGTIHMRNPRVIELAQLIGRSTGAVSYKLANFARLDPGHKARGIRGLEHGAKGEIEIWKEFYEQPEALAFESERLLANLKGESIEEFSRIAEEDLPKEGLERERLVRQRVNQNFFRKIILAAYDFKCCITGLAVKELLVASHIVPWAADRKNRMNPRNGLCMNALHDRAFDRGLMTILPDNTVRFCDSLLAKHEDQLKWLVSFHGKPINLPKRFTPDAELMAKHGSLHSLYPNTQIAE
jgi:putative restriction endonuclease